MQRVLAISLGLFLGLAHNAVAQENKPAVDLYGYASMTAPVENINDYSFKWVRLGAKAAPAPHVRAQIEYDVASERLAYAYARAFKNFDNIEVSLLAGQFLGPVPYLYSAPFKLQPTRWPVTLSGHSIYNRGIGAWIKGNGWTIRVSHFESGMQATLSVNNFSFFWEEGVGHGIIASEFLPHTSMGVSQQDQQDDFLGFVRTYVQLDRNIRVYGQLEALETDKDGEDKDYFSGLLGATWTYTADSFLKLYYDWQNDQATAEFTFSF